MIIISIQFTHSEVTVFETLETLKQYILIDTNTHINHFPKMEDNNNNDDDDYYYLQQQTNISTVSNDCENENQSEIDEEISDFDTEVEDDDADENSETDFSDESESVEEEAPDYVDDNPIKPPLSPNSQPTCYICLNEFEGQDLGSPDSCANIHHFCLECIEEWSKVFVCLFVYGFLLI